MTESTASRVVIAGGGVAALETLLALSDLAHDRVAVTLVAPEERFSYRPMSVAEPFAKGHVRHYELSAIADEFGARLVRDAVAAVDAKAQTVRTRGGDVLPYDHLVLAGRGPGRAGLPARHHLRRGSRRGGVARAPARCRRGLRGSHRVHRARPTEKKADGVRPRAV